LGFVFIYTIEVLMTITISVVSYRILI